MSLADFNPRIPQGMRPCRPCAFHERESFQSTHSAGNATTKDSEYLLKAGFQSTHSAGNATNAVRDNNLTSVFQSTHSAGNATVRPVHRLPLSGDFNPRIPQGMRHLHGGTAGDQTDFNPRIPQGMRLMRFVTTT